MNTEKNNKTVLLVMDIQETMMNYLPDPKPLLVNIEKAISTARQAGMTVIYATLAFRDGHPEIAESNPLFSPVKASKMMLTASDPGTKIHSSIRPMSDDIIVRKRRVSAFSGSDLEMILRAHKTEHLVLSGFSTTGVVLSTLREAADKDYQVRVLSDACADPEPQVHDFLVKNVFPFSGEVLTTDEWVAALN
jgi:nicotinamidase-related amidase